MKVDRRGPHECKALCDDEGWVILDVRTDEEFRSGHPTGAYHIPWAFRGQHGMEPNHDFLAQVKALFPSDSAKLVLF